MAINIDNDIGKAGPGELHIANSGTTGSTTTPAAVPSPSDSSLSNGVLIAILTGYFLPTLIAMARRHRNGGAIFMTNLLLGWTGIGWIAAIIWAFTAYTRKVQP